MVTSVSSSKWMFISVCLTRWIDVYFCPSHSVTRCLLLSVSLGEQMFTSVHLIQRMDIYFCPSPGEWMWWMDIYFCPSHPVNGRLLLSVSPGEWTFTSAHLTWWRRSLLSHPVIGRLLLSISLGEQTFTCLTRWLDVYFCPSHLVNRHWLPSRLVIGHLLLSVSPSKWTFTSVRLTRWMDVLSITSLHPHLLHRLSTFLIKNNYILFFLAPFWAWLWQLFCSFSCARTTFYFLGCYRQNIEPPVFSIFAMMW